MDVRGKRCDRWTDPDSPRVADLPALDHPVQIDRWLSQLSMKNV